MEFIYTQHAEDKLKDKESKSFPINKNLIEEIILTSKFQERLSSVQTRATGNLSQNHSLVVVYNKEYGK